jgi:hypothetical protein
MRSILHDENEKEANTTDKQEQQNKTGEPCKKGISEIL